MTLLLALIVLAGLYVGANIGANDAGNCMGPSVGARIVRYRVAVVLVAVFVIIGALLQGGEVMDTVGKGIVSDPISPIGVVAALMSAGLFVSAATFYRIPVSTSQAVVGGVAGVGLAAGLTVDFSKLFTIVQVWVICPVFSCVLTYLVYRLTLWVLRTSPMENATIYTLRALVLVSTAYAGYSLGANNLGNAIGPIAALSDGSLDMRWLVVAGAASIALGALLFGYRVTETVGRSIIPLDIPGAFSVQISAAAGLHIASMIGIPVSTSQAVVGALMGIGLYHGVRSLSRRKLLQVVIGWVATPFTAGITAFILYRLLNLI